MDQYSKKLKHEGVINIIQFMKFKYAVLANYKKEQIEALKKINIKYFSEKAIYIYLQWMIRIYCIGDKEVIGAVSIIFPPDVAKEFSKKTKNTMRLLLYLQADYEEEQVNENDVLSLLDNLSENELGEAYYLLVKISKDENKAVYVEAAKRLSENTYLDELLYRLIGEKK